VPPLSKAEKREIAINTVIAMAMAVSADHPEHVDIWVGAALGSLAALGVSEAEMAAAVKNADFVDKDPDDLAMLDSMIAKVGQ